METLLRSRLVICNFWFRSIYLQSWATYLGQTLVLMWNNALREKFNSISQEFLASIDKVSILGGDSVLGYNSTKFWDFLDISLFPKDPKP